MKIIVFILVLFCLYACNFKLKRDAVNSKPNIYFFLNAECPICLKYQGSFKEINKQYADSFNIYFVFPGELERKIAIAFCAYDSINKNMIILDNNFSKTRFAKAVITPQAVIVKNNKILYSGKIDDRFMALGSEKKSSINYVKNALNSLLKNEPIAIKETEPIGCLIEQ